MKKSQNYGQGQSRDPFYGEDTLYAEKSLLKKRRQGFLRVFGVVFALIIALLLLYFAARMFFKVESFEVNGNEKYTDEQIISLCGIESGDFMFSFGKTEVKNNIYHGCPYIEEISIKRVYPSSVVIDVRETQAQYAMYDMGKYIVFSSELKVLEVSEENKWDDSLIIFELPKIERALEGYLLEFKSPEKKEYITEFIKALGELETEMKINTVTLSDSFSIKMLCGGAYRVLFGKADELSVKMHTLTRVMQSETIKKSAAASIDMSDPKEPRVVPYDNADMIN